MKIVQSFWSYPNLNNHKDDPNGRYNGGWINRENSLSMSRIVSRFGDDACWKR